MIELQFDDQCRLRHIATRNHHKVGIALASGIFAVDDILVPCPDIDNGQHAGKRVLIVVGKDAGVLVVGDVDGFCHNLLIACDGGIKEDSGILYSLDKRFPRCSLDGIVHFICHLLIWNVALISVFVVILYKPFD